jgi:Arc/MetJ-type ribon-helix-helix transcriptional regulator
LDSAADKRLTSRSDYIRRRLKRVQEQAAAKVQLLTAAETKLTAAIVVALLSTRGKDETPLSIA